MELSRTDETASVGSGYIRKERDTCKVLEDIKKQGFVRVRVNGEMHDLVKKSN